MGPLFMLKKRASERAHWFLFIWELMGEKPTLKDVMPLVEGAVNDVMDHQLLQATGALFLLTDHQVQTAAMFLNMQ